MLVMGILSFVAADFVQLSEKTAFVFCLNGVVFCAYGVSGWTLPGLRARRSQSKTDKWTG